MTEKDAPVMSNRAMELILIAAITVAAAGYLIGVHGTRDRADTPVFIGGPSDPAPRSDVHAAVTYSEMPRATIRPNAKWRSSVASLVQARHDDLAVIPLDPQAKRESLAQRSRLRAFNGAPPVVPHPIDQMSAKSCLVCHEDGLRTRDLNAVKVPHPLYTSCTQCHVESSPAHLPAFVLAENSFEGLPAPFEGPRAWPGAPPIVPHSTWMRDDCLSCHGPNGWPGMQTTHPERMTCLQCHAPSAALNQTLVDSTPRFLDPPEIIKP